MMKKVSALKNHIIPFLNVLTRPSLKTGYPFCSDEKELSNLCSHYMYELYPDVKDIGSLKVEIVVVDDTVAKQFAKESELQTFSFDIEFIASSRLACYEWRSKFETKGEGRPLVTVKSGLTPAFLIFVDYNLQPLVCMNMYYKNFNSWAERIGLKGTRVQRTENPSTHYVYREKAQELGLLWFNNPALESINQIKDIM